MRPLQVLGIQPPRELAAQDLRAQILANVIVDRVAQDRRDRQQDRRRPDIQRLAGLAGQNAPTANSSESPGRIGVTTSPVSQKMIANRIAYVQTP